MNTPAENQTAPDLTPAELAEVARFGLDREDA